ncbi:hypothetical protein HELRODRAFT_71055 [Helobdella robusta]|uniref:Coronin n=1 Tax=Helobdella robusta TaxID=6412 RepID=T1G0G1_HELRO|nr:hypothetical protein HELRODRAFT_71055 [Helobdella robusta]ESN90362.1 hypothetical protein HELRODRAFT_71055 [Helobdella robusta]
MFLRSSKFRHVFGCPFKKEACYEGLKATKSAHDTNFCAVNPQFLAVVIESSGGGDFVVLPIEKTGRLEINSPKVCGHRAPITDLKWCPHDDTMIASASDDSTIKIWKIPENGLQSNLNTPVSDLNSAHYKRVSYIEWHPTVRGVLLSAGADFKCIVWNSLSATVISNISLHPDLVFSISWNIDGSLFATTCKDKKIRVICPRTGNVVAVSFEGTGHQGNKSSRIVFLKNELLFTTGFSRSGQRQHALWDSRNLSKALRMEEVDAACGFIYPHYDPDLNIIYLAGKGDGNIRYVEIIDEPPYIYFLNQFQSSIPQRGLGMMPKRGLDMKRCEIARFFKLHSSKDVCEPISMIVPRKSDMFQPDIYPPTQSSEPSLSIDEWLSGLNKMPIYISLEV